MGGQKWGKMQHGVRAYNLKYPFVVPRLEHVSVDVSRQAAVHEFEVGATVPASPSTLRAVARVTNQNRFEALSEDIADVVGQPSCTDVV